MMWVKNRLVKNADESNNLNKNIRSFPLEKVFFVNYKSFVREELINQNGQIKLMCNKREYQQGFYYLLLG